MNIPLVNLKKQYDFIKEEIKAGIDEVLNSQHFIGGEVVKTFEQRFAQYTGCKHCIGVSNGTDAITVTLKALEIEPGDEVIVPANTFVATAEAVVNAGATPVFVDCHPDFYTVDVKNLGQVCNSNTKAIIPVHLYGQMTNMQEVKNFAEERNLKVIEDAAQAHGSSYNGKGPGNWGDVATYSFYPGKNLGAYGDAGAIVTNNDELAHKIRRLANHGRIAKYDHDLVGYNNRLDALQAKVLTIKLKYLDDWTFMRRKNAALYTEFLHDLDGKNNKDSKNIEGDNYNGNGIVLPVQDPQGKHVYHLYVIRTKNREDIKNELQKNGIGTGIHYPIPLPRLKAFDYLKTPEDRYKIADQQAPEILSLPMYPELQIDEIKNICDVILGFVTK